jgi:MYXO-CTERM domain-containing protein
MHKYWNIFGLLLIVALAVTESSSAAPSTTTFNFSGTCSDCSGTATASLVLAGSYTLGTPITSSNFVSFTYNGTNLTGPFTYTPSTVNFSVSGSITNIPGSNAFVVAGGNNSLDFITNTNGTWFVGLSDQGTAGTWSMPGSSVSPTPAPPTSIWLLIGLMSVAAFGVWQRRRNTA